jgi:serine/threonine-protein kinase
VAVGGASTTGEGEWLGHYEILHRLEAGARHEVLLARAHGPSGFTRIVELKRYFGAYDRFEARRLAREARAHSVISSPGTVRLYDFSSLDGDPVLVLEHVPGLSLEEAVRSLTATGRELPEDAVLYVGYSIFAALSAVHATRMPESSEPTTILHRNICPASVRLAWTGAVKLGGFDMAKVLDSASEPTRPGILHGTFGYIAPEQLLAGQYSTASDVYSAALIVYELLSRRRAFDVAALPEWALLQAMAHPSLPPLASLRPYLHPSLCAAVTTALAPRPENRTIAAAELATVLGSMVDLSTARETCVAVLGTIREEGGTGDTTPRAPTVDVPDALPSDPDATERFRFDDVIMPGATPAYDSLRAAAAMALSDPPKRKSEAAGGMTNRRAAWIFAVAFCSAMLAFFVGVHRAATPRRPPTSAPASSSAPSTPAAPQPSPVVRSSAATPTPGAPPPASASASEARPAPANPKAGLLLLPPRSAGHRIFVDGRVVGEGPHPYQVACGARRVRVGSAGVERVTIVPCGGSVQVP